MTARILFVSHGPADPRTAVYGNFERRVANLRALGYQVDLITPETLGFSRMAGVQPLLFGLAVARRAHPFRYDMVVFHSHCGWASSLLRPLLDPSHRTRLVVTFHGLEPLYHEAVEQELRRRGRRGYRLGFRLLHRHVLHWLLAATCRRADTVLCLSTAEREYLVRMQWVATDRVVTVANGVEDEMFTARDYARPARRLLFLAQWLPAKGTHYLVDAFVQIAQRNAGVRLACVGTGQPAEVVRAAFPESVRGRVDVIPTTDRAGIAAQLRLADILVFPSLSEGFGNAIIEAMAAGLPVVSTSTGAAADMLRHDVNALLVPFADSAALVSAVERLIGDPALCARLGTAAHRTITPFTWERVHAQYAEVMRRVLEQGRASGDTRASITHQSTVVADKP